MLWLYLVVESLFGGAGVAPGCNGLSACFAFKSRAMRRAKLY